MPSPYFFSSRKNDFLTLLHILLPLFPCESHRVFKFAKTPFSQKKKDLQLISQYFRIRASDGLEFNNFLIRVMKIWLIALFPILASCWWDVGHMLSAAIAEMRLNQLNPSVSIQFR